MHGVQHWLRGLGDIVARGDGKTRLILGKEFSPYGIIMDRLEAMTILLRVPMVEITYFAVLPFSRTEDGDFLAETAIEMRTAEQAKAIAAIP
jgi:hypothetical protein